MKSTDKFTEIITNYLRERCRADRQFCERCKNPNKSIAECIDYIFYAVKQSGCNGFSDEEIFSIAVHYFDEPELKFEKIKTPVVVNNCHIELTEQEKTEARQKAIADYQRKVIAEMQRPKPTPQKVETEPTLSLF